ncbi:MAG: hypothetical protein L0H26_12240, partial [Microlunatus sp.]|nr:hypothetical protein [Microlunatus sp.]
MSSNLPDPVLDPDATGPIAIQPPARQSRSITLRTKLIAGFVVTIIAVTAVIGIVTQVFLSDYLLKQLDSRVMTTQVRFGGPPPGSQPGSNQNPGPIVRNRVSELGLCTESTESTLGGRNNAQPDDSILGVVSSGTVTTAALRSAYPSCTQLTAAQAAPLASVGLGQP